MPKNEEAISAQDAMANFVSSRSDGGERIASQRLAAMLMQTKIFTTILTQRSFSVSLSVT